MISKLKFIISICLSASLGLCWYPLVKLEAMHVDSSQLLFFAFSAASILTVPFLAFQVGQWRTRTLELLVFGLVGGISTGLLHYAFLNENPVPVASLFLGAAVAALFFDRLSKGAAIKAGDFLIMLSLTLVTVLILLTFREQLTFKWAQLLAVLAGVGFHQLMVLNKPPETGIPLMSKVAAVFLASTWLVGIMLIFSPRSTSFPEENYALYCALYGGVLLLPMVISLVHVLVNKQLNVFFMWVTLLLGSNLAGALIYSNLSINSPVLWLFLVLVLICGIQLARMRVIQSSDQGVK